MSKLQDTVLVEVTYEMALKRSDGSAFAPGGTLAACRQHEVSRHRPLGPALRANPYPDKGKQKQLTFDASMP